MSRQAPGPWAGPAGHLREMRRDVLGLLLRSAQDYGDVVRLRLGPWEFFLLNHPDLLQTVFQDHHPRYDKETRANDLMRGLAGDSTLTLSGEPWLLRRRMLAPYLSRKSVGQYAAMILELTDGLLDDWEKKRGQTVDVASEMTRLTCRVISRALFSADLGPEAARVEQAMLGALQVVYEKIETPLDLTGWLPGGRQQRLRQSVGELDEVVFKLIARRRGRPGPTDLLSRLLDARDADTGLTFDDRALRDETVTMLLAGHDTTANTLAFVWHLLGRHPEAHEQLFREVEGKTVGLQSLQDCTYLSAVVNEALRLYPPIWIIERRAREGDELGGYTIPPGSTVLMSPFVTHRNPEFWSQPEEFRPDRFLPGARERPRYAYYPFGGGPRQCLGQNFALLEANLIVARMVQRVRLQPPPDALLRLSAGVSLRPRGGLLMGIEAAGPAASHFSPPPLAPPGRRERHWLGWSRQLRRDLTRASLRIPTRAGAVEYLHLGQGPVVLGLHGSPGGYDQTLHDLSPLCGEGLSLLAPSRPGYLRTRLELAPTLAAQADLMAALLDKVGLDRVGVAGLGTGGAVAVEFCLRHPGRARALALLGSPSGPFELGAANSLMKALLFNETGAFFGNWLAHASPRLMARQLIDAKGFLDPEEAQALLHATLQDPARVDYLVGLLECLAPVKQRRKGAENDLAQLAAWDPPLQSLTTPTLVVHGSRDADVPFAHAARAASRVPRSRLLAVEGGTHLLRLAPEWPDLLRGMAAFLRDGRTGRT